MGRLRKGMFGPQFVVNPVVPTVASVANYNLQRMTRMPESANRIADYYQNHEGHYPTLRSVVSGLGFDRGQEATWKSFIRDTLAGSANQLAFRQAFYQKARADGLDPVLSRALLLRANQYARQTDARPRLGLNKALPSDMTTDKGRTAAQSVQDILMSGGDDGIDLDDLNDLVSTYGPDLVAMVLKAMLSEGAADFDGERFYGMAKSGRFVVLA